MGLVCLATRGWKKIEMVDWRPRKGGKARENCLREIDCDFREMGKLVGERERVIFLGKMENWRNIYIYTHIYIYIYTYIYMYIYI